MLGLCVPLIFLVKARLPLADISAPRPPISYAFVKSRTFVWFQLSSMFESLGYNLPTIYLSSYAISIGLPRGAGTLVIALLNCASIVGALGTGYLCDHLRVTTVISISTIGSTLSVLLFWGLATDFEVLILFALSYGIFAGGFSATWSGMIREIRNEDDKAQLGMLGLFNAGRGLSSMLSGPLSGLILKGAPLKGKAALGYGTGYGALILFTAISAFLGMVCFGAKRPTL